MCTPSMRSLPRTSAPPALPSGQRCASPVQCCILPKLYVAGGTSDQCSQFVLILQVREFLMSLPHRAALADVGCGNGKYFRVRPDLVIFGSDRSSGLAEQAAKLCRGASAPASTCNGSPTELSLDQGCTADIERAIGEADGATAGHDPISARPKAQQAPLADVLVADALQLPYQVCVAASPSPVAFPVDPHTSQQL